MHEIFSVDALVIDQPANKQAVSDASHLLMKEKHPKLTVVMDATHSGVITNRRVYPGMKVAEGHKTFVSKQDGGLAEYSKPVLLHHDEGGDPVGRIKRSVFTNIKTGREFELDYLFPDSVGGKGSGVVTLTAEITDPEAIQKIIDGRYLSVSSGHSTDMAFCSICTEGIFSQDCSHVPGFWYDQEGERVGKDEGSLCYAIYNNMTYHEVSFVNIPAQPPAKLLEFNWGEDKLNIYDAIEKGESIASCTRAKKDIIKVLSLSNDEMEFSLLTGSEKSAKQKTYSIASSTAEKLREKLENKDTGNSDEGEIKNDHPDSSGQPNNVVESRAKKDDKETGDETVNTVDNSNKEKEKMDELQKENDRLKAELDQLKSTVATVETERDGLKQTVEAKDSEIQSIKESMASLRTDMSLHLATALASHRIRLSKPDTKNLETDESKQEYISTLAKRSPESLKDSLNDISLEVNAEPKVESKATSAADILSEERVESDTLAAKDTPKGGKKEKNRNVLDTVLGD